MSTRKPEKWNVAALLKRRAPRDASAHWDWLAEGRHATLNYVQSRGINAPHDHDHHDEVLYVLEGEGSFRIGDDTVPLTAGDVFFVPAGTVHTPIIGGTEKTLSIYAPPFDPANPDRRYV